MHDMPKKKMEFDFGKSFKELEEIAAWFDREEPDLDRGLVKFERAMELAGACRTELSKAEQNIQDIRKKYGTPSGDGDILDTEV
jgi:exodeoxyribonuclease VII small subunit